MQATFLVMAGGAIGAALRYQLGAAASRLFGPGYPWGTLAANLLGCLAIGLLAGTLTRNTGGAEYWRLFAGVGVLGGFTTFSAFSLELVAMIDRGAWGIAALYATVSVTGSLLGLFAGLFVVRTLVTP